MADNYSSTSYDAGPNSLDAMTTSSAPVAAYNAPSSSTQSDLLSSLTTNINNMLGNRYIRVFIFVVAAVYAGYTLTPVPKQLNNLFAKSNFFKYMILFFVSISLLHPLDNTKLTICLIIPVLVLGLFHALRKNDSKKHSESTSDETSSDVKKHERKHSKKHTKSQVHTDSCSDSSDKKSMVAHAGVIAHHDPHAGRAAHHAGPIAHHDPHAGRASPPGHAGRASPPGHAGRASPPGHAGRVSPPGHAGRVSPPGHAGKKTSKHAGKKTSKHAEHGAKLASKRGSREGRKLASPKGVAGAEHFFI
jgi:hypothetical protein